MQPKGPQLGVKMSPGRARAYVDRLKKKVLERWEERVTRGIYERGVSEQKGE